MRSPVVAANVVPDALTAGGAVPSATAIAPSLEPLPNIDGQRPTLDRENANRLTVVDRQRRSRLDGDPRHGQPPVSRTECVDRNGCLTHWQQRRGIKTTPSLDKLSVRDAPDLQWSPLSERSWHGTAKENTRLGALGVDPRENLILSGRSYIVDDERQIRKCGTQCQQRSHEPIASRCRTGPSRMFDQVGRYRGVEKRDITGGQHRCNIGIEAANEIGHCWQRLRLVRSCPEIGGRRTS